MGAEETKPLDVAIEGKLLKSGKKCYTQATYADVLIRLLVPDEALTS